ncbi:hypothetical protein A3A20_02320 [Candidatus Wolfebacteria bacterium RIFCSPLOWO2_01_FULL_45_19]|uniref:Pseudouridine synthase n=1 Tax=Candidatus Wolfebacteria bacterium RIFCSPLOWO2_01_FULL_45_19 TaxID=1802557 RepID=A0A1F8DTL4_9BACT|nr:MAG: Pseudouridine synthase [Parcubacteria group bacterium GW2011_GWB1_45_9]OGM91746.1 MAG: hypothetical protein A3A20_02320 [Candidatus Wolfebacteria bacterium RIFCSPLOWO2_01_FULL_45_19]
MKSLNIVYEDDDFVAVNKPAGMLTHPTSSERKNTLVNFLVERCPEMKNVGDEPDVRPGILHRLDRDTSGLILAAKNQKAFLFLKEQFLNKSILKKYLVLVEGAPKQKTGIIEYAIRPSRKNWLKKVAVKTQVDENKKSVRTAKTEYKILKSFGEKYAFLEVRPFTGRTHQIRVHLSAIGHPIVGDALYGAKEKTLKRPFLHAYYLQFIRPNGMPMALEADLPKDLQNFLDIIDK